MNKKLLVVAAVVAIVAVAFFWTRSKQPDAPVPAGEQTGTEQVATSTQPATGTPMLQGTKWQWVQTENAGGTVTKPADSSKFVLTFNDDESFVSTTDCNSLRGALVIDGEVVSMGQIASTKMFCEGSVEAEYSQDLQLVGSRTIDGDTLTLIQLKDAGTMTFTKVN